MQGSCCGMKRGRNALYRKGIEKGIEKGIKRYRKVLDLMDMGL